MSSNITNPQADELDMLVWSDALLLGYGPMDTSHQEFVEVASALIKAADWQVGEQLQRVERHLREHFGTEDRWMNETAFPASECHMNEHAEVLHSLDQVKELFAVGNTSIVRRFGVELLRWFPGHADYLDSALSHWMSKARLGGKPIVLRRNLSFDESALSVRK